MCVSLGVCVSLPLSHPPSLSPSLTCEAAWGCEDGSCGDEERVELDEAVPVPVLLAAAEPPEAGWERAEPPACARTMSRISSASAGETSSSFASSNGRMRTTSPVVKKPARDSRDRNAGGSGSVDRSRSLIGQEVGGGEALWRRCECVFRAPLRA